MSVTAFQDLPLADRDREWDGDAAEKRVRKWAGAEDEPNQKYRDAHVWYDGDNKDNFTAYKLLIADVVADKLEVVPRGVMAAGAIMEGARGGSRPAQGRHRPREEPPRQVLQEDGRDGSLGALTRPTRCVEVDQAGGHREPRAVHAVDVGPADRDRDRAQGFADRAQQLVVERSAPGQHERGR